MATTDQSAMPALLRSVATLSQAATDPRRSVPFFEVPTILSIALSELGQIGNLVRVFKGVLITALRSSRDIQRNFSAVLNYSLRSRRITDFAEGGKRLSHLPVRSLDTCRPVVGHAARKSPYPSTPPSGYVYANPSNGPNPRN
jgi:hypothetical protein